MRFLQKVSGNTFIKVGGLDHSGGPNNRPASPPHHKTPLEVALQGQLLGEVFGTCLTRGRYQCRPRGAGAGSSGVGPVAPGISAVPHKRLKMVGMAEKLIFF